MAQQQNLSVHDKLILESIFNPNLPFDESSENEPNKQTEAVAAHSSVEWKRLESEAVKAAENGETEKAVEMFNQAVSLEPENPSSYNNRAQCYRLLNKVNEAKVDLDTAISKSEGVGQVACQAFIQRAMIRRLEGDDDGCRADFQRAADLGSRFAKQQLVALNPYAALCNAMLNDMVSKLRNGESECSRNPTA